MRSIQVARRYLLLPVKPAAPNARLAVDVAGKRIHEFDIEWGDDRPACYAPLDLKDYLGQTIEVHNTGERQADLSHLEQSDTWPDEQSLYREPLRPGFHFTCRSGWLNDPNGLVYHQGLWHLYYQHNPFGWGWGNMHWGHAVSEDLVHWRELPLALYPRKHGDWAYSGSGFVTHDGKLAIAYTSTGRGECIAISDDAGLTFSEIPENPVVVHKGRDPKVFWYEPAQHWVMVVYQELDGKRYLSIHTSKDLRQWTFRSRIEGFYECPELFPLATPDGEKWVLYGGNTEYLLGDFDGFVFHPTSERKKLWFGMFYASQTYTNAPDNRRIQIGWERGIDFPGMCFNQQMSVPCELSLVDDALRAWPVAELAKLRTQSHHFARGILPSGSFGALLDIETTLRVPAGNTGGLSIHGVAVRWDRQQNQIIVDDQAYPFASQNEQLSLRLLLDRRSIEIFAQSGRFALAQVASPNDQGFELLDAVTLHQTTVHELASIWDSGQSASA